MNTIPNDILIKCKQLSQQYSDLKQKQKTIEKELDSIKNYIEYILLKYNTNHINTNSFSVIRKIITQNRISKEDLPEKLFQQYSHPITFSALYIQSKDKQ